MPEVEIQMNVHHGIIKAFDIVIPKRPEAKSNADASVGKQKTIAVKLEKIGSVLIGRKLQDIHNWCHLLSKHIEPFDSEIIRVAGLLDKLMPVPDFRKVEQV